VYGFELLKKDLIWLLHEMRGEYYAPSKEYRKKEQFRGIWQERLDEVLSLKKIEFFPFNEHDGRKSTDRRLYAKRPGKGNDGDNIYGLIRKLALPETTFFSILKLQSNDGEILFYFKIFPEYIDSQSSSQIENQLEKEIKESSSVVPYKFADSMPKLT